MTLYAQYDPTVVGPSVVIGWYDTAAFDYTLPPAEQLLEVPDDVWAARRGTFYFVLNGQFTTEGPLPSVPFTAEP